MSVFNEVATKGKLTLGLVFPIESYQGSIAKMENQEVLAKRAEVLGFKALWFRDVPFHDPTFGDAGQLYDTWVYMTHIMNQTNQIALASGSIILPLRHPVHTAKSLASIQLLSKGRVLLGVASGDRPSEFPAFGKSLSEKSELFKDSFNYLKTLQGSFPVLNGSDYGQLNGTIDLVPKYETKTPMFVTGHSGQNLDWIAENADGWLYYPRNFDFLKKSMQDWQNSLERTEQSWKPYMQSLYIDLMEDEKAMPKPIHLGFQAGSEFLVSYIKNLENHGVNHVILNLKYGSRPADVVVEELGEMLVPHFS
ncbi:LLM class oxidoreductase [Croceivirga thetidis]|uniref:LLM class oxidoreductase n=1 Tax=Croceivirga thetidis TaxID=2721623 RepID=A0ABX1GPH8_9FLAO|nr:LLM class oxidoreductase [Croceivirga thetidis]NKI31809.1 LLM class oxidoreductase [Croceivirga thetidis]